jgi:hypothetical protein
MLKRGPKKKTVDNKKQLELGEGLVLKDLKCQSCLGFKTLKLKDPKLTCSQLGYQEKSLVCPKFQSLYQGIDSWMGEEKIMEAVSTVPQDKLDQMIGLLWQEKKTRKLGYHVNQEFMISIFDKRYLSNWAHLRITYVCDNWVYGAARFSNMKGYKTFYVRIEISRLVKIDDFRAMINSGKILNEKDPRFSEYFKVVKQSKQQQLQDLVSKETRQLEVVKEKPDEVKEKITHFRVKAR